jgi:TPR repeat protein
MQEHADKGHADAQVHLGMRTVKAPRVSSKAAYGHGAPQDIYEALRLFKRAAAKGHAGAAAAFEKLEARLAAHSGQTD